MILDFDDSCWSHDDRDWQRSLVNLLAFLDIHQQHSLLANPEAMLAWCSSHLISHLDYFKTRLASAQVRANALTIRVSPSGAAAIAAPPPWTLTAEAARDVVSRPLRLVLENDQSDRKFVESTVPSFSEWCKRGWIAPAMGGGTPMEGDIAAAAADSVGRWRTFYLFDSDRLHPSELEIGWKPPGGDGCQGYRFELACVNMPPERWHRLNRRSIENYLPHTVLNAVDSTATTSLFGSSVADMAHFYNLKKGLAGDGVHPADAKKTVRASRSKGFWGALAHADVAALQNGFGPTISNEFTNVPSNHSWPADVMAEMDSFADLLQDAM